MQMLARSKLLVQAFSQMKPLNKFHKLNSVKRVQLGQFQANIYGQQQMKCFSTVVKVPSMGDSITEGTVFEYAKQVGDFVNLDEIIAIIETDKIKVEIRSPSAGKLVKLYAALEDSVEVGAPFYEIDESAAPQGGAAAPTKQEVKKQDPSQQQTQTQSKVETSSAPQKQPEAPKQQAPKQQETSSVSKSQPFSRNERREKMSKMRQVIAKRLKQSQNEYALLTTFQEVDMSAVMELRNRVQDAFVKKHNVKLGFMSFFIKASCQALKDIPAVNAVIDGNEIVYRDYCDVSVAVATPAGLLVPVLRNCESQSFADIEKNLIDLANKGKTGKITTDDMAGGTFTISNGGVFGSLMGTPILNPPQSAILGMHAIINKPVCVKDQIVARPMMYLALTYDHRLIDGREAATFLKKIQGTLQDPTTLLFDL